MNWLYEMRERPVFFRKNEPQINADERRLINSDDDPCLSILNSILSRHLFNRTYSSHNYCN
jgi:hypothetical protein